MMGPEMMGSFSIWHFIGMVFWFAVLLIPAWRIVSRAGYPGVLSLLLLIPVVNLVMVWIFAFVRWPNARDGR